MNCNLVVVNDGILVDCFKGTVDELNNAILYTYGLHKQENVYDNKTVWVDVIKN